MQITKKITAIFLASVMLITCACAAAPIKSAARDDFRAVWVSTVYNLDYPAKATTKVATLKAEADKILKTSREMGMNAIVLQVRPSADAIYKSDIFPWSKYLTGTCGTAPASGFDPLEYWITQAHAMGMELHAWVNPYRITKGGQAEFDSLPANSPAVKNPEWVIKHTDGNFYFNPGEPEVREMVIKGAEELANNYDIDGFHMDDYFYPEDVFADDATFEKYGKGFKTVGDWRRDNVNKLVKEMGERVHKIDSEISYGISPAGVWANKKNMKLGSDTNGNETYFSHFADSRTWVKNGWIDYICPQIYWEIGNKNADYKTLALWWADVTKGTGVKLYIGMADYRACSTTANSVWAGTTAIENQLDLNKTISEVAGEVHFRYGMMAEQSQIVELYKTRYGKPAIVPPLTPPVDPPVVPTVAPQLNRAKNNQYVGGDEKGHFNPQSSLTRAEAVSMVARLTVDENGNALFTSEKYSGGFSDVKQSDWFAPAVAFAAKHKIVAGYADGTFAPNKPVTRAEFVKIVTGFEKISDDAVKAPFKDVASDFWAAKSIAFGKNAGWLGGYTDGTFAPNKNMTRTEAVKTLNGALGREPSTAQIDAYEGKKFPDVPQDFWGYYQVMEAAAKSKVL